MLFKESAVYSENDIEHKNKLRGHIADFLNSKAGDSYSYHCVLKVCITCQIRIFNTSSCSVENYTSFFLVLLFCGCDSVYFERQLRKFRRNFKLPSSGQTLKFRLIRGVVNDLSNYMLSQFRTLLSLQQRLLEPQISLFLLRTGSECLIRGLCIQLMMNIYIEHLYLPLKQLPNF